jgi:hypothetical protein
MVVKNVILLLCKYVNLQLFENELLRTFELEEDEVSGWFMILYNETLSDL